MSVVKPIESTVGTIFIHVKDLKKSVLWYSKLLGIKVDENKIKSPIFTFNMGLGSPGLTLDDHSFDEKYDYTPSNQPLFNMNTSDIDSALQHVKNLGAEDITDIQIFPDLSEFCFKDPDGNILMVCKLL